MLVRLIPTLCSTCLILVSFGQDPVMLSPVETEKAVKVSPLSPEERAVIRADIYAAVLGLDQAKLLEFTAIFREQEEQIAGIRKECQLLQEKVHEEMRNAEIRAEALLNDDQRKQLGLMRQQGSLYTEIISAVPLDGSGSPTGYDTRGVALKVRATDEKVK